MKADCAFAMVKILSIYSRNEGSMGGGVLYLMSGGMTSVGLGCHNPPPSGYASNQNATAIQDLRNLRRPSEATCPTPSKANTSI